MNGKKLRAFREAAGMTQQELAEKCYITNVMVCRMEDGTKDPSVAVLKKLAEVLGCTADELLS